MPAARGRSAGSAIAAEDAHGAGGLGDLVLPPPALPLRPEHGVFYLIDALRSAEPKSITLCALGPLTNIAMALVAAPEIAAGIAELVIMGGGSHGNITAAAEFNIYADPHAAALVFDSGLPITMVPLDVTEGRAQHAGAHRPDPRARHALSARQPPSCSVRGAPSANRRWRCTIPASSPICSRRSCSAGARSMSRSRPQSPLAMGMTLIDWRGISGRKPNARVIEAVDADGVYRLLAERLARLP